MVGVGDEAQLFAGLRVGVVNLPKRCLDASQKDFPVCGYPWGLAPRAFWAILYYGVGFQPGNEINTVFGEHFVPVVIVKAPIKDGNGSSGQIQGFCPLTLMQLAVGQRHKGWQIAIGVYAEMQLDGTFGFPELGPGKHCKTQVNGGGVEQIELVFKLKTMTGRYFPTPVKEFEKQPFVQGGWLLFIHSGKSGSGKRLDGKMVELVGLS